MNPLPRALLFLAGAVCLAPSIPTKAQSNRVSEASAASLEASVQVPLAIFDALKAGGRFTLTGVQASAEGTVLVISVAPAVGSLLLTAMIEPGYDLLSASPRTSAGTVLVVSGGLLLMLGHTAIAFLPDPSTRPLIHSRRIGP